MIELLMSATFWIWVAVMVAGWLLESKIRRLEHDIEDLEKSETMTRITLDKIPKISVEVEQGQWLAFDKTDSRFVGQGTNLADVVQRVCDNLKQEWLLLEYDQQVWLVGRDGMAVMYEPEAQ